MVYSAVAGRRPAKIWIFDARCRIVDTPPGVGGWYLELTELRKVSKKFAELTRMAYCGVGYVHVNGKIQDSLNFCFRLAFWVNLEDSPNF